MSAASREALAHYGPMAAQIQAETEAVVDFPTPSRVHNPARMAEFPQTLSASAETARDAMLAAIREGQASLGLPYEWSDGSRKTFDAWVFVAESGEAAGRILLEACSHTLNGRDGVAAEVLRRFIDRVAADYAEEHAGCY